MKIQETRDFGRILVANQNYLENLFLSPDVPLLHPLYAQMLLSSQTLGFDIDNVSSRPQVHKSNLSCLKMRDSKPTLSQEVTMKEVIPRSGSGTLRPRRSCKEPQAPFTRRATTLCGPSPRSRPCSLKRGWDNNAEGSQRRRPKLLLLPCR